MVVSNQGKIHYIFKDKKYVEREAVSLFNDCVHDLKRGASVQECYNRALSFLARCSESGLFYT